MQKILFVILCSCFIWSNFANAATRLYTVQNIPVLIEGASTMETRDKALLQAERMALAGLAAAPADKLKAITDTILSRTMKDFSLQNERVLSQSYQASFTIRFDAMRFDGMLKTYGLELPVQSNIDLKNIAPVDPAVATTTDANGNTVTTETTDLNEPPRIIILPILKTGIKFLLWDESNVWSAAWQKKSDLPSSLRWTIPLGDIEDLADIPDAGLIKPMTDVQPGFDKMLGRYQAQAVYILSAQVPPTAGSLLITLYRYKDKKMEKMGRVTATSRPGYLFDDAVTFAANHINHFENPPVITTKTITEISKNIAPATPQLMTESRATSSLIAVVPIQNLTMWLGMQQQLRQVPHVTNLVARSLNTNQAIIQIEADTSVSELVTSLQNNGFTIRQNADGRYTLSKQ